MATTEQRLSAIDKKARRQARHKARKMGVGIEAPINSMAAQLRGVGEVSLEQGMFRMYQKAKREMGQRVRLSDMARNGNVQAGKARRALNDWQLGNDAPSAKDAWSSEPTRPARGKCDADSVNQLNKAKRGY